MVAADEVHLDDGIPILVGHFVKRAVAQDSRVVHHTVHSAEVLDRSRNDGLGPFPGGHAGIVRNRAATVTVNLFDDLVRHASS